MDRQERHGARQRLEKLTGAREGQEVRDEYSHGMKADIWATKKHPYQCEKCEESYLMAPQLSDHLQKIHGIHRHPSQILPKAPLFEKSGDE